MPNRAASCLALAEFSESAVVQAARQARAELDAEATCAFVFFTPDYASHLENFLDLIRLNAQVATLIGCSGGNLIGAGLEAEERPGFSLLLLHLPHTEVSVLELSQEQVDSAAKPDFWRDLAGSQPPQAWLALTDPFRFNAAQWLGVWNAAFPGVPTLGGLASGVGGSVTLCRDGRAASGQALAVGLRGGIALRTIVSQGCRPIGEPMTITGARENVLLRLGAKPAYSVLNDVFNRLNEHDKARARGNLFAGVAASEYLYEHKRGDFLIRNILAADPDAGAVEVGAHLRVGQTLQYQLRDRDSADEDLRELCHSADEEGARPFASLMFSCTGRGRGLFAAPNHDAGVLAEIFGPHPSAGFFCNGEIGPIGAENHLHGYTASLALLCDAQ